jgi:hypothetical protein
MESNEMRVNFLFRTNNPERLVCEAEVIFGAGAGPMAGMKLVGFSLWRSPEGEVYVTFPSRAFGAGNERRFFDYLRSAEGDSADARRVKAWILDAYRQEHDAEKYAQEHAPAFDGSACGAKSTQTA